MLKEVKENMKLKQKPQIMEPSMGQEKLRQKVECRADEKKISIWILESLKQG